MQESEHPNKQPESNQAAVPATAAGYQAQSTAKSQPLGARLITAGLGLPLLLLFVLALALPFLAASCGDGSKTVTGFGLLSPGTSEQDAQIKLISQYAGNEAQAAGFLVTIASLGLLLVLILVLAPMVLGAVKQTRLAGAGYALVGLVGAMSATLLGLGFRLWLEAFHVTALVSVVPLVGFKLYVFTCFLAIVSGGATMFLLERKGKRWIGTIVPFGGAVFLAAVFTSIPACTLASLRNDKVPEASDPDETPSGIKAKELLAAMPEADKRFYCKIDVSNLEYLPSDGFRMHDRPYEDAGFSCFKNLVSAGMFAERPDRKECVPGYGDTCSGWLHFKRWAPKVAGTKYDAMMRRSDGLLSGGGPLLPCYEVASLKILTAQRMTGAEVTGAFGGVPTTEIGERITVEVAYALSDSGQRLYSACPLSPGTGSNQATKVLSASGTPVGTGGAVNSVKRVVFVRGTSDSREFRFNPLPSGSLFASRLVDVGVEEAASTGSPAASASAQGTPNSVQPDGSQGTAVDPATFCDRYVRFIKADPSAADFDKCKGEIERAKTRGDQGLDCISRCTMNARDKAEFRRCCTSQCHFNPPGADSSDAATPGPVADASDIPSGAQLAGFPDEIPEGRSHPPNVAEWASALRVDFEPKGCFRKVVREWLKLNCSPGNGADPKPIALTGLEQFGTEGGDYFVWVKSGQKLDLIARLVRKRRATAKLEFEGKTISVGYDWSSAGRYPLIIWQ